MDSDRSSSCDSLDEILNNLEDSESDECCNLIVNNTIVINDSEKTVPLEKLKHGAYETQTISAECDKDTASIFTEKIDKVTDKSDQNNFNLNAIVVKHTSPSLSDSANSDNGKRDYNGGADNKKYQKPCSNSDQMQKESVLHKENKSINSDDPNFNDLQKEIENPLVNNESTSEEAQKVQTKTENILIETKNPNLNTSSDNCKDGFIISQFLDNSQPEAEARLAARRAARAEAREIRMREVERQQREQEENADQQFHMQEPILTSLGAGSRASAAAALLRTTPNLRLNPGSAVSHLSSRRSSEDSLEDTGSLRDLKHELKDVEEKFRKAMIANAQLDNDKSSQTYQLELLKDRIEELEEAHAQLRREHRDKCREYEQLQRQADRLKQNLNAVLAQIEDRDRLIAEKGLVIVGGDDLSEDGNLLDSSLSGGSSGMVNGGSTPKRALVSAENAQMLEHTGEGSLDVRLARFSKERSEFQDIISHLRLELEEERNRKRKNSGMLNGPSSDVDFDDQHRVASKQLDDFKFRAQKAEQDVATLQANVARLESQVIRYKSSAEASEKSEEALKTEKRKLQREARDAQSRSEELETANTHLIKRLDKLKTAKSALLKEL